jgi:hypothetical protein
VCYCLKLRRETPAGVALGVTDWKVVERIPPDMRANGVRSLDVTTTTICGRWPPKKQ